MIPAIRSLFAHQAWADTELLNAIQAHEPAREHAELHKLLHHILMVQRYFHALIHGEPIDLAEISKDPASFEGLRSEFDLIHQKQASHLEFLSDETLTRRFELDRTGLTPIGRDILLQVVMHSHGHRAQAASILRNLGGTPPVLDYILWAAKQS